MWISTLVSLDIHAVKRQWSKGIEEQWGWELAVYTIEVVTKVDEQCSYEVFA